MLELITERQEASTSSFEDELELKRSKHLFTQWLISGNRRSVPPEVKAFIKLHHEEARTLFNYFRKRSRVRAKGKKYLFVN